MQLPEGSETARWHRLDLRIDRDLALGLRIELFDWERGVWVRTALLAGKPVTRPAPPRRYFQQWTSRPEPVDMGSTQVEIPSPRRFVNPRIGTLLVRASNGSEAAAGGAFHLEVTGNGNAP